MSDDVIRTLERVGTPPTVLSAVQALNAEVKRIEGERYRPDRETAEIAKAQQAAASQIERYLTEDERAADAERDRELKALEAELVERASIPRKRSDELDAEYTARLVRRQIEDTQRTAALMLALADVTMIGTCTDPGLVAAVVDEALATKAAPEAISRIGRAAEARLAVLAADESKNNGGQPGPAFQAHVRVGDTLRTWRAGHARESVEARRDQVLARHTQRVLNTRSSVAAAARAFGIEQLLTRAATKAALQTDRER